MKETAKKVMIGNVPGNGRVNVVGSVERKEEGLNSTTVTLEDSTGRVDVVLRGGLSLLARGLKKGDLAMAIGDVEGTEVIGEIIIKLDNPNYERLRVLETGKNG